MPALDLASVQRPEVLVLDDQPDVAASLAALCGHFGFPAMACVDSREITDCLRERRPRGLILDLVMPEHDGYEALSLIARHDPTLPVLLVSGYGENLLELGVALGRAQGLTRLATATKPLRGAVLRDFLATLLAAPT